MPPVKKFKFLLVLLDTFSGWVEAFPTTNKQATTVASLLLTEIIPQFGIPSSFQSDNGPEFVSQISQHIATALNIPWHFHIPYHPQSSGKVEHTNRSLKETLTKLSLELHLDWTKLLPLGLFKLRALPKKTLSNLPFRDHVRPPSSSSRYHPIFQSSPLRHSPSPPYLYLVTIMEAARSHTPGYVQPSPPLPSIPRPMGLLLSPPAFPHPSTNSKMDGASPG
ncbi:uncharacterized protein [Symphalangus syndactylus]|uniref:uncharacterized protein isoform X2 n=1 Tax=Symphalangus syndactylus TaxID=9590 RepID=UPI0030050C43